MKVKNTILTIFSMAILLILSGCNMPLIHTKGLVATAERDLMITAVLLMLIVVIPVFIMTFVFAWKYRASNPNGKYSPNWTHSTILEIVWWGIPIVIVAILGTITWITTHDLDPYKPLDVPAQPMKIQVVALNWKWLFIYPEQNIATVNFVEFPSHVPIEFDITADAPMNSFWIPQLGGQIYAMTGMQTKLHLIADEDGDYEGLSANYSGAGFSWMRFIARTTTVDGFNQWAKTVKQSPNRLSMSEYDELRKDSENNPVKYYSNVERGLFSDIMMKFMGPATNHDHDSMSSMSM